MTTFQIVAEFQKPCIVFPIQQVFATDREVNIANIEFSWRKDPTALKEVDGQPT